MLDAHTSIKHSALFYNSEEELARFVAPYFKEGLEKNEICLWILPKGMEIGQAKLFLENAIDGLSRYLENGQMQIESPDAFYLQNSLFSSADTINIWETKEKKALLDNFEGLRVVGDGSWAVGDSWFHLLLYEQDVDKFIQDHKMKALCSYSLKKIDLKKIFEIGTLHPTTFVNQAGHWITLEPEHFNRSL